MIAQAARRADNDMRTLRQHAPFARGIHAADARGDARAGLLVEPGEFAADLQRQFARGRDHQRERCAGIGHAVFTAEQLCRDGKTEGDGLARAGLRRDDEVASVRFGFEDGGLNRGGRGIAACCHGGAEGGGEL